MRLANRAALITGGNGGIGLATAPLLAAEAARVELEQRLSHYVPLGRLGEAEDVAKAVLYLASDDTRNVTGTEIVVDGGTIGAPYGAAVFRQR